MQNLSDHFRGTLNDVTQLHSKDKGRPDDLDLSQMARQAMNYLRGNPDPNRDYECKFSLGPLGIPCHVPMVESNEYGFDPVSLGDTDVRMDWQYPHMREMIGETAPDPVELGVRKRVLSYEKSDHFAWINPAAYVGEPVEGTWIGTWTTAKLLFTLSETYQRTQDDSVKENARGVFLALRSLAQWDGDRAYYWGIAPYKDGEWLSRGWCQTHARNYPFIVEPCVRYWECTGDEEGLALAKAFTEGFLAEVQPDQGKIRIDKETGAFADHVHLHTHTIWGVAHLGAVINEPRYIEWARKVYEFVLSQGTDYGWYPEFIPQKDYRTEICVVGDMVSTGVWLARGASPHYWDQVERTIKNELRRAQFSLTPEFLEMFNRLHADKPAEVVEEALAELRKLEGGFVAQPEHDDWVSYHDSPGVAGIYSNGVHMMGCCPPEGMRGLWEAWSGVVEDRSEGVFINMSLTRDHPAASVTAYRPEDGGFEVTSRKPGTYFLRPPAWAEKDSVQVSVDGQSVSFRWGGPEGAYAVIDDVQPSQQIVLRHPVPVFTQVFIPTSVPDREESVTVRWVGNSVVEVLPHGKCLPMFRQS